MRFPCLLLLSLGMASPAGAVLPDPELYASFPERFAALGMPASLVREETFSLPASQGRPERVAYGNAEVGFFRTQHFRYANGRLTVELVPPSYREPTRVFVGQGTGAQARWREVGSRRYQNPFPPALFPEPIRVKGRLSFPFALYNWHMDGEPGKSLNLPVVINRLGELVWAYWPGGGKKEISVSMRQLSPGRYGFMGRHRESDFEVVDYKGKVERRLELLQQKPPIAAHHVYGWLPESNELLILAEDCRDIPWYRDTSPVFRGLRGWWNLLRLPRHSFLGTRLYRVNLLDGHSTSVWSSFDSFSPDKNPNLWNGNASLTNLYQDVSTAEEYLWLKSQRAPNLWEHCDADWDHANSVQLVSGQGYLISLRNLNKVAFLGLDGHLRWTMGTDPTDTFRLPKRTAFALQHSASMLPDGRVLLYANNTYFRGMIRPQRPSTVQIYTLDFATHQATLSFEYVIPYWASAILGSTELMPDGRLFVYHPSSPNLPQLMLDVSMADRRIRGQLEVGGYSNLSWGQYSMYRGVEARPLWQLTDDEPVELTVAKPGAPAPLRVLPTPEESRPTY